ncbi:unnamed protein product [Microthlaspi erraticum]|uniref:Uncharacterized protein n=1 Tax=Microthlaspi erraticum TaxID=1685480 RepID=A0A6D2KCU5_9BRAS|nr:unnamed protein product [Microthlaspi erraticum]
MWSVVGVGRGLGSEVMIWTDHGPLPSWSTVGRARSIKSLYSRLGRSVKAEGSQFPSCPAECVRPAVDQSSVQT